MVGEDDHQEFRAVAEKSDRLWALHGGKQHVLANIVEEPEPVQVAAVNPASMGRGSKTKRGRGGPSGQATRSSAPSGSKGSQHGTPVLSPAAMARMGTGLCHFHWSFGDKASKCEAPCNWQGN